MATPPENYSVFRAYPLQTIGAIIGAVLAWAVMLWPYLGWLLR